ncbi:MAG: hypothetical protein ACTSSJ_04475 [Candidatus Odinarchaeia archaeon]
MLKQPVATIKIGGAAIFAAMSSILQFFPLIATPWGMIIDLVAVPWVLCYFIFGFEAALLCSLISLPAVGIIGGGGIIGASMKFIASIWMFLIPALFTLRDPEGRAGLIKNPAKFAVVSCIAIGFRDLFTILFNFYFAIPVFFGLSVDEVAQFAASTDLFGFFATYDPIISFALIIAFWNTVLGVIDLVVTWMIVHFIDYKKIIYLETTKNQQL